MSDATPTAGRRGGCRRPARARETTKERGHETLLLLRVFVVVQALEGARARVEGRADGQSFCRQGGWGGSARTPLSVPHAGRERASWGPGTAAAAAEQKGRAQGSRGGKKRRGHAAAKNDVRWVCGVLGFGCVCVCAVLCLQKKIRDLARTPRRTRRRRRGWCASSSCFLWFFLSAARAYTHGNGKNEERARGGGGTDGKKEGATGRAKKHGVVVYI